MTGMDAQSGDARAYARIRYRLLLVDLIASTCFLLVFQCSGLSVGLAAWWGATLHRPTLVLAGYLACFGLLQYGVFWPLHFYGSFLLEHRFHLSRLTVTGWLVREAKHVAVGATLGLVVLESFYAIVRRAPATWPIWATIGWVGFNVILARIFPTVLLPIFYKTTPVEDERLVKRLVELCKRAGLAALGVFRFQLGAETRKANAALAGFGKTRRVLLSDTLVEHFSPDEIETVLAHELGHQRHRHIGKFLALSAVGSLIAFWLVQRVTPAWMTRWGIQQMADPAGFPILMLSLTLIGLLGLPLQNAISRRFEWQADRFAVSLTHLPAVFASALRRLGELNLADPNPPRWVEWLFYDHPPLPQRIRAAELSAS